MLCQYAQHFGAMADHTVASSRSLGSSKRLNPRARMLVPALLLAGLCAWFWLALGPWFIGPSDWDDTMYVDRAVTGAFVWDVRNRYVHVWAIRLVDLVAPTHRSAAAAWAALCVCAMAGLAYYAGQRMGQWLCGVIAALLTLLFPPMLTYLSVPHVDFSMALFSMLAVCAAAYAVESERRRSVVVASIASGVFGYLALKSKETGLVVPPLCAYLLFGVRGWPKWRSYAAWLAGLGLGFCVLFALDHAFLVKKELKSSDPGHYFAQAPAPAASKAPAPAAPPAPKAEARPRAPHEVELVTALLDPTFAAFTLLGCAGFARGARRNVWAHALGLWALSVFAFTVLISVRYRGVDAQDRYLIAVGAALAPLAAYQVGCLLREPGLPLKQSLFFLGLLVVIAGIALWALWGKHIGDMDFHRVRAFQLTLPLGMLLLFLAGWFTPRIIAALAACVLLGMSSVLALDHARVHRDQKRHELEPWNALSQRIAATTPTPRIAVLHGRSYRAARLRWRLRVLATSAPFQGGVRDINSADQLESDEWVFVGAAQDRALESRHYQRLASLDGDPNPWSLYTPVPVAR